MGKEWKEKKIAKRVKIKKNHREKERRDKEKKEETNTETHTHTKLRNKYRGGTSDATTSSSLIVPLSVDDFSPSKTAIFGVQK